MSNTPAPGQHACDASGSTSDVHPNVTAYRGMIAAFNASDLVTVEALLHADVEYTLPGKSPLACHTRGIAAHLSMLKRARELSGGTLKLEPRAIAADGEYLVVWGRISATRSGKQLESDHCVMYRFCNGKIVEGRTVPVDQYEFDAFWS